MMDNETSMDSYNEMAWVPRRALRFPLEVPAPSGFRPEDPVTWPKWEGRLEYVGGRLWFMPPCGDVQQDVAASVIGVLEAWAAQVGKFIVGSNEAGMLLGGEVRGAEAAIWAKETAKPRTGGYRRSPPLLAVEVAGEDEGEPQLREKAQWYLRHGVEVVWLILPESREVVVLTRETDHRYSSGQSIAAYGGLPGLTPQVNRFFRQLDS